MIENRVDISDEILAARAADGDRAAFDTLVRRYARPLLQYVAARTGSVQDAEDIVQETFMRSYQHIDSFDGSYPLKNWLYTIAYRTAVSAFRRKRPLVVSQETVAKLADTPADPPGIQSGIWSLAGQLKPDDYTVLWLRYKQEMKVEEIAHVMNKTQSGVRVHLHRARNRLAERLEAVRQADGECDIEFQSCLSMERTQ